MVCKTVDWPAMIYGLASSARTKEERLDVNEITMLRCMYGDP